MARGSRYMYGDASFSADEFSGLTNRTPITAGDWKRLRHAVNVDLTREGKVRRRTGRTSVYSGTNIHSLWGYGQVGYFVEGSTLKSFRKDAPASPTVLRTGLSISDMSFVALHGDVFYSNGDQNGCLTSGLVDSPWWVETPRSRPNLAALGTGGLDAGEYQAAVTYVDAQGRESAAQPNVSVYVEQDGGIAVSAIPVPVAPSLATKRLYLSSPADPTLYLAVTLPAGATDYTVGVGARGQPLRTQYLDILPAGELLEYHAGRIWAVKGQFLYYTEALHYGLYNPRTSFFVFPTPITGIGAVEGDGLYVLAGQTYFLAGSAPEEMEQTVVRSYGGPWQRMPKVPATAIKGAEGSGALPVWMSDRGLHVGLPRGQVVDLTEPEVVMPRYTRSATLYREQRGVKQLLAVGRGGASASLGVGDSVVAEVRRNGIVI